MNQKILKDGHRLIRDRLNKVAGNPEPLKINGKVFRPSQVEAQRLWYILIDLEREMDVPFNEYLDMDITDVVRKDLERLPEKIIEWLKS